MYKQAAELLKVSWVCPFGSFEDGQSPEDMVEELHIEEGRVNYEVFACDIAIPVLQVHTCTLMLFHAFPMHSSALWNIRYFAN